MQAERIMRKHRNISSGEVIFAIVKYTFIVVFTILCIYPFYYVIIYSLSDPSEAAKGVYLWPKGFTLNTFRRVVSGGEILPAFFVSVSRTVLGTISTVFCTSLLAFLITRKELPYKKVIYRYVIITMYLSAGLIPGYVFITAYGFKDSFWVYIIPGLVSAYHMILVKTFIEQLPESLEESAAIEGAGFLTIFLQIVLPLSKPIIATISVYNAVGQWNAWRDNFFYVSDKKLQVLQMILQRYLLQARAVQEMLANGQISSLDQVAEMTPESVQMTTVVITVIPILLVYPFAQRYFTKGIMMGAVKG